MNNKFTVRQFNYRFPTEDACLEEIKLLRFGETPACPKCGVINKFYKLTNRKAYACSACRYQLYPLAGTIFEKSTTPLKDWFYAIYLMTQTRSGMSAKQLERMLGVTYKTAWRMFHQIRKLMAGDDSFLSGEVEVDETYVGGKGDNRKERRDTEAAYNKEVVMGMVQRGGQVKAYHVKSSGTRSLIPKIQENVLPATVIYSDEWRSYIRLTRLGFYHDTVHHRSREYVRGPVHTQTIEGFWSQFKRGIMGVYRHVDPKYLQAYVDEYTFRYSNRDTQMLSRFR